MMKDIYLKATCPYKADVKCDAAINALCDNKCVYHPRYMDDGLNENYKVHRCPYSESTTCSGETCGSDCFLNPDYDGNEENCKQKFKKIDRPDLDFDINEDACSLLKDKSNWNGGLAPCVDCERDCPITAGMTELTYDDGYEQAMIDCSGGLEDAYLDGYKDSLYGEPPVVEDDELREVLSVQPLTPKGRRVNNDAEKVVNGDLYISGKILCMIENAKEKLFNIRKQIYSSGVNSEKEQRNFALELFNVVKILDDVQHQYTSDALYEYLGYME